MVSVEDGTGMLLQLTVTTAPTPEVDGDAVTGAVAAAVRIVGSPVRRGARGAVEAGVGKGRPSARAVGTVGPSGGGGGSRTPAMRATGGALISAGGSGLLGA